MTENLTGNGSLDQWLTWSNKAIATLDAADVTYDDATRTLTAAVQQGTLTIRFKALDATHTHVTLLGNEAAIDAYKKAVQTALRADSDATPAINEEPDEPTTQLIDETNETPSEDNPTDATESPDEPGSAATEAVDTPEGTPETKRPAPKWQKNKGLLILITLLCPYVSIPVVKGKYRKHGIFPVYILYTILWTLGIAFGLIALAGGQSDEEKIIGTWKTNMLSGDTQQVEYTFNDLNKADFTVYYPDGSSDSFSLKYEFNHKTGDLEMTNIYDRTDQIFYQYEFKGDDTLILTTEDLPLTFYRQDSTQSVSDTDDTSDTEPSATPTTTPKPSPTPTPTPKAKSYGSGTYKVGTDLPAGEYFVKGSGYVEVASDSSGNFESIVDNDNTDNRAYVTVYDGQYLKLSNCSVMAVSDATPYSSSQYASGMYKVGRDIPAGEYQLTASASSGYWERSSGAIGTDHDIIANDNFSGTTYVTVYDGEYLILSNCLI